MKGKEKMAGPGSDLIGDEEKRLSLSLYDGVSQ
jgi:hypothetical protein